MNVSDIMRTIKKATAFDIFLITFFILPFIFKTWIEVFTNIGLSTNQIIWSLAILFFLYIFVVIVLVFDNRSKKRKEIAKDLILGYLIGKRHKWMSFNRVRQEFGSKYSDEFIEKLIQEYPKEIRRVTLKDDKPAIGRVVVEITDEEEA